jgi:ATP-binding cassette subfamily B protein
VEDGKIIERGTHSELMEKRADYYRLYTRQFEEEAEEEALRSSATVSTRRN